MLKYGFLVFSFFFLILYVKAENASLILEVGPKRLYRFNGIGDQVIFHWPALKSSSQYLVQFSGTINQTGSGISVQCESNNVTAIVRRNAIPLPNPRNADIPENTFVLDDGYLFRGSYLLSQQTQDQIVEVTLNDSFYEATDFFVSLFLPSNSERFDVSGLSKKCRYYSTVKVFALYTENASTVINNTQRQGIQLSRQQESLFQIQYLPKSYDFNLSTSENLFFYWDVFPLTDSGGTLDVTLNLSPISGVLNTSNDQMNATILGCLIAAASESQASESSCSGTELSLDILSEENTATWHFPFPVSGTWTFSLSLLCNDLDMPGNSCVDAIQRGQLSVSIASCVDNCNVDLKHGSCGIYRSDAVLFSACRCKVDWMGIACNDGRNALSYATQLLQTLLLTLSNLMFIPCVLVAIYRKFYTEALVYFFVCFMSSFYHACDQPGEVVYCLLPYETLQFSDFLSSITAIWFTLIAVAKLPSPFESFMHVLGLIAFAVCVSFDRFNVWTTVVPAVTGVIVVVSKWGFKCHKIQTCYPGLKKTLFSIIPGVICAGVGLSLYAFLETSDNYYIVHSIWHILMACAVLFLLPIGPKSKKVKADLFDADAGFYSSRNGALYYDVHNNDLPL